MSRPVRLALCAALALALAGCWIYPLYPKHIEDVGDTADYPLSAAGFERGHILSYAPGGRDVSIHYRLCGSAGAEELEVLAVLRSKRVSGPQGSVKAALDAEWSALFGLDPPPDPPNQESVKLSKNGRDYVALKWSGLGYGYSPCFRGSAREFREYILELPVPRHVELFVWQHEDRILSLQSFASFATPENRDIAPAKNLELLDAVNWSVLPF